MRGAAVQRSHAVGISCIHISAGFQQQAYRCRCISSVQGGAPGVCPCVRISPGLQQHFHGIGMRGYGVQRGQSSFVAVVHICSAVKQSFIRTARYIEKQGSTAQSAGMVHIIPHTQKPLNHACICRSH